MVKSTPIFTILVLLVFLLTGSCAKKAHPVGGDNLLLYPAPPDAARIQFLTRYGSSEDFTGNPSKFKTFVAGKEAPLPIQKPYGITLHNGSIYIVDAELGGLEVLDLQKNTFEYFQPSGRGKLRIPINCDFDSEGKLYVSDVEREQVVIFDQNLNYQGEIGGDENFRPSDVFIYGDSLFATDPKNNRINVYDLSTRSLLYRFPDQAEVGDDQWLYNPLNLYVAEGKAYVTDFGNSRIKVYSLEGEYLRSVGSYGRGLGQFVRPKGIAVDKEENLYVVDAGFQNIQVFNKTGQLLMFLGGPYHGPGDLYLPANISIDYDHLSYYEQYVAPEYKLIYLIFVTNQYGPDKITVYGRIEPK